MIAGETLLGRSVVRVGPGIAALRIVASYFAHSGQRLKALKASVSKTLARLNGRSTSRPVLSFFWFLV